ncbi:TonB-dependent receptor [Adhaeribacter aerolatus]|uniref:TonB-dependent receptor n=1 Tax=Adhaeribacter aerolatus TaxID=670289 RepID=A0A512B6L2_9BACT|nr:outer membrane beta-barrel family protein [Adhaeribacter aerolatus]GEO07407.1 TonB-dependent receptor [Adhaeribacter aerolatus]
MEKAIYLLLIFSIFLVRQAAGQLNPVSPTTGGGKVRGTLIDQNSRQPVGYANIIMLPLTDTSQIAGGAMTDERGNFSIDGLPYGQFVAKVSLVGYKSKRLPVVSLTPEAPEVRLGTITFAASSTRLQEVEVQGERPTVAYGLDRKVVNVAKDLTSIAGSATDVMKNVPSVTVDADGGISMRGSSNLRILIDGRPTGMVADNQAQILEQIPASSIESVEIITNPSSKFDAEGEGGIINIILKKEKNQGFNGLASVNVGTNNRYNASVGGNYRYRKWNIFGSYDFRKDNRNGYGNQERYTIFEGRTTRLDQDEEETRNFTNNAFKIGADFTLTPTQTITASWQYRNRLSKETEEVINQLFGPTQTLQEHYNRTNLENDRSNNTEYTLGYRKTFAKKGRELTADLIYSAATGGENQDFTQRYLVSAEEKPLVLERSDTDESNSQITAQVDFSDPVGEDGRFDAGYKSIISTRDDDYRFEGFNNQTGIWQNNPGISNNFIFDQQVHALYATYGNKIGKTSYQLGSRLEYTANKGLQKAMNITAPDTSYLNFFPSVFITQELDKDNQIQVSYSRRINRPGMWDLNPFVDVSDPLNPRGGNPALRPEFSNALELSQIHYGKNNSSLNTTLFYRKTTDVIQRYRRIIDSVTTFNTDINLASRQAFGLEFIATQNLTRNWKINGTASAFRNILTGTNEGTNINNRNFSWTARLNSNLTFWKGLDLQVAANYRSPVLLPQGTMSAIFFTEMALKKDVLNKKGTVSFRLNDIFNTMEFNFNQTGENFRSESYRKRQSRIAFIGFSYRFGNTPGQNNRQRERRNQDNDSDDNGAPEMD